MLNLNFKTGLAAILGGVIWSSLATAQMFGDEPEAKPTAGSAVQQTAPTGWSNRSRIGGSGWGIQFGPKSESAEKSATVTKGKPAAKPVIQPPAKVNVDNPEDYQYKNIPQIKRPTLDGVKRGTVAIQPIALGGSPMAKNETLIFLYYSDFTVNRMMSGTVTCDVKFQVLTTLNRRLNNLSIRLRWPDMETALSFTDIAPNQPVHYNYTLLGEGCYSMDKVPNIIVNRCRVKGLSQQECAAKIRWLRK